MKIALLESELFRTEGEKLTVGFHNFGNPYNNLYRSNFLFGSHSYANIILVARHLLLKFSAELQRSENRRIFGRMGVTGCVFGLPLPE
jgi:hypothetical protein